MKNIKLIISGFGGQGALFAGRVLSQSVMQEDYQVTFLASYGAEMRGGTANCHIKISDTPIGSPLIENPNALIALNLPSFNRYIKSLEPNGDLILNSSLINQDVSINDLKVIKIPASEIAEEIGSIKAANIVCLGAFIKISNIVKIETVESALIYVLGNKHKKLTEINLQALRKGFSTI